MKPKHSKAPAERVVKDIRRATRKQYSAEEKIRIVLEGLRGEDSIAELCRREGIAQGVYYKWSKDFMEAGKRRLAGDTARAANTDEAIALFSDKNANETILIGPYEDYVQQFNEGVKALLSMAPTVASVDALESEEEQLQFIKAFRNLIRLMNVLNSFSQFAWADLYLTAQAYEDYKSKYLDLYEKSRAEKEGEEKASIIEEVDFELELIRRDEINVTYILALLAELKNAELSDDEQERRSAASRKQAILDMLGSELQLRSKRELIEKFIEDYLPDLKSAGDVENGFETYWNEEREQSLVALCKQEGLNRKHVEEMIAAYHFTQRPPLRDKVVSALETKPKILERKSIIERVTRKLLELVHTFDDS